MSARTIAKKSKFFSNPVTGNANMILVVHARWPADLGDALLSDEHRVHDDGQRERDLDRHQDGAGAVAQQRGENWSQSHGYCTFR